MYQETFSALIIAQFLQLYRSVSVLEVKHVTSPLLSASGVQTIYSWSLRSSVVLCICCGQEDRVIGLRFPASTDTFLHSFRTLCGPFSSLSNV